MLKPIAVALLAAAAAFAAPAAQAQDSIRFAVTDIDGAESLQREFGPFKAAFEKVADVKVQVSGRTAAVEAMAAGQVDFVLTGPAEYVVFKARTNAVPVVGWQRPDYFSQVAVLASGPIKSVADLKGKTISFGEIGSTSQHLGPAQALADFGLTLPEGQRIRVWDSTAETRFLVIPMRPAGTEGWSEDKLASIVNRDAMIGTGLPRVEDADRGTTS